MLPEHRQQSPPLRINVAVSNRLDSHIFGGSGKYEKKFWVGTRKALLRTQWARWSAGKPLKGRAAPRAPAPAHTESRSHALRLSRCPDVDTGPGCARHPACPVPRSGLCFVLLKGTQAWWPASSEPTAGVKAGTGRAQGPRPAPCQYSPSQRHHCTKSAETLVYRSQALCCDKLSAVHTTLSGRDHDTNASTLRWKC